MDIHTYDDGEGRRLDICTACETYLNTSQTWWHFSEYDWHHLGTDYNSDHPCDLCRDMQYGG